MLMAAGFQKGQVLQPAQAESLRADLEARMFTLAISPGRQAEVIMDRNSSMGL